MRESLTCYETRALQCLFDNCNKTNIICVSHCTTNYTNEACNSAMQCANGSLVLGSQFCYGVIDCFDESDEIRNHVGLKCTQSAVACALPQSNLYDNFAHCSDGSDICDIANSDCLECLDKGLLISAKQICDGVIDCYDFSDECFCEINFDKPICDLIFSI